MTTPQMWNRLVRELMADSSVRKRYQFWSFYYPTAQPVPLPAMQLRDELDQAVAVHGPTEPMASAESEVVVPTGHGGFAHPLAVQELIGILHQDLAASGEEVAAVARGNSRAAP
ncbi:hypothetical protein [Halochromatium sp.]